MYENITPKHIDEIMNIFKDYLQNKNVCIDLSDNSNDYRKIELSIIDIMSSWEK